MLTVEVIPFKREAKKLVEVALVNTAFVAVRFVIKPVVALRSVAKKLVLVALITVPLVE